MDDSERFQDAQTLMTCPYNAAHTCPKFRMSRHLLKCRKHNEEIAKETRTCPFNSTHIIPQIELAYHETICADRELFYTYTHKVQDNQNPAVDELFRNTLMTLKVPREENWDDELDLDQDIVDRCKRSAEERGVLQSNSNQPPAERKALRLEQRMKTRERLNAEDERKRIHLMNEDPCDDFEPIASYCSGTSGVSFVTAQNAVEKSMENISKPSSSSSSTVGRGRGKSSPKVNSTVELGFGRAKLH